MSKDNKPPKPPSIFTMAKNFAGELAKYIKEGAPNVSNKIYTERLETCKKCPHLNKENFSCNLCGCLLETKAKWKTTTCPDKPSRWRAVFLNKNDIRLKENFERQQADKTELYRQKEKVRRLRGASKQAKILNQKLGRGHITVDDLKSSARMKMHYGKLKYEKKKRKNR